ncbi:plasma-membrane proton-efflux P-type ATPase [Streptomyces malaysiense]|uniref:Plasma-membrane proton-efflux P-type ATPase n=2 Tax=Streptomyces malaysiense TaxID=1428626 RepID=A0A1J4Q5N1_9ACTN|nr:plasma-membrane proton-efflux P-type ATPase [Streptomyces malaysiense]
MPLPEALAELDSTRGGLSGAEAHKRLERCGPNAIEEHRRGVPAELASFFWGPIPWMIEVALVLSGVLRHWDDVAVIGVLLVVNAAVGFWQEHTAADAVAALKSQLALRATVCRDGGWRKVDAAGLVPGDVVRVRLGDIVPADVRLLDGEYLSVDQSALTGESMPADKREGDAAYSGSVAVRGDMTAVVTHTGSRTYFGRTTRLVAAARPVSHFQKAVLAIGDYLIWMSLVLVLVLVVVELFRGARVLTLLQFALILTVAAIPVAMPAVLSVTMAVGAVALSKMKAIVTRLESIEEMAGIDVLCSDKTGTLTENRLTLGEPVPVGARDGGQVVLAGALACAPETDDAIDRAVLGGLPGAEALRGYRQTGFVPFDPVGKRTSADITGPEGSFTVTKGAPQVVLALCDPAPDEAARADEAVRRLAAAGRRALGVARRDGDGPWRFLGLLPLSDPPRPDSADTVRRAVEHGITVKMLTGDNSAIAAEVAGRIGLGTEVRRAGDLLGDDPRRRLGDADAARIEAADGFAEVFPEHKYAIVKALQERGHVVGMTGDGVNDAPALKQADTGVAVSGATDAARSAADLVLTAPGLSVIIAAIERARIIFERMNSYAIYRVTETIRIVLFVVAAMIAFNTYPINAILIILLALFNDLPIMTIAVDNTPLDPQPVRWDMRRVLSVATVLGTIGVVETFLMLLLARQWLHLDTSHIQTLIFLKLAVAGHLTLFVARSRGPLLSRPWPAPAMLWAAIGTKVLATALVGFGLGLVTPVSWAQIGFVWVYCIAWVFVEDWAKLAVYRHLDHSSTHHRRFLGHLHQQLHPAPAAGPRGARQGPGST